MASPSQRRTWGEAREEAREKTTVQKVAVAAGAVFVIVGILGFTPGITSQYDQMQFAGHDSDALLLGLFQVSFLHNFVHLLYGIAGLVMGRSYSGAKSYLTVGGVLYLVLWIYGVVIDHDSAGNFVPFNAADNWLHLFLGMGMVGLGVMLSSDSDRNQNSI